MRSESVLFVWTIPAKALWLDTPTNTEHLSRHKIWWWVSTYVGKSDGGIGWWSWSCCGACVRWDGFRGGSRKKEKSARKRLSGELELLPGGRLSSLCLPWDSSAALNMPVIFNQRRNRAQRRPLSYNISFLSGGEMDGSHTSWSHGATKAAELETFRRGSGEEQM